MHLLESQNIYPDCVFLTLDTAYLSQGTFTPFSLILTLNFGEQWDSLLQGRIKFRLRGGKIHVTSQNGQIKPILPINNLNFSITLQTDSELIAEFKLDSWQKDSNVRELSVNLAQFMPISHPCQLTVTCEVSPCDLFLVNAEELWKHDITPNKHAILERKIIHLLHKNRFTPYLSSLQLVSDNNLHWDLFSRNSEESRNHRLLSSLQEIINQIYAAETDDFIELAKIAELNPLIDLSGGNLLATSLNGVELGEANLNYTNFRGANLTDVDFSEAQLSYANFSGADLSGAYLGNADLSYADFHRGSLALANLIGANLTGADLRETNLSQANLSGAKVEQAVFSHNVGLTLEMKENLQQRGAIFQDT